MVKLPVSAEMAMGSPKPKRVASVKAASTPAPHPFALGIWTGSDLSLKQWTCPVVMKAQVGCEALDTGVHNSHDFDDICSTRG